MLALCIVLPEAHHHTSNTKLCKMQQNRNCLRQLIWTAMPDVPNQIPMPQISKQLPNPCHAMCITL